MHWISRYWNSLRNRVDRKGTAIMGMIASLLFGMLGHSFGLAALAAFYVVIFAAAYAGPTQNKR